jgi:hypothetical protein
MFDHKKIHGNDKHADLMSDPAIEEDMEARINWERKRKGKKRDHDEALMLTAENSDAMFGKPEKKGQKAGKRKRRQLIYDETLDRMVVKRKRKRTQRAAGFDHEDEWDAYL